MKSIVFKELPVHDTMWSITTGRDGNIYAGICGELTGGLSAFIARYCPDKERIDYLLEVSPALGEPTDNGRPPHSKLHEGGLLPASDGKLYGVTHCSGPPVGECIWRPWHTWDDLDKMFPGFHIFSYDPKTEEVVDFGAMSPNEGSRASCLAEKRGLIYGITWPRSHFYIYNLNTHEYKDKGRISDEQPQVIWIDKEENAYLADDTGHIFKYIADEDRLICLDVKLPDSPSHPAPELSVVDAVPSPDWKTIYGATWNMERVPVSERLFCFDPYEEKIYDLGPGYRDEFSHIGGLVFGDDGYLYYAASRFDENRRIPFRMYLLRLDVKTGKREEIGPFDDGEWHSEYIDKATKDFAGNLYFADTNNRPPRIYIYSPEPEKKKEFRPRWPFIRSWG